MTITQNQNTKRDGRLFKLYQLRWDFGIIINNSRNIEELAINFNVSTRTIRRDLKTLEEFYLRGVIDKQREKFKEIYLKKLEAK